VHLHLPDENVDAKRSCSLAGWGSGGLWELEDLAFKYLEPEAYRQMQDLVAEKTSGSRGKTGSDGNFKGWFGASWD